ncbi:MAG: hypothetical protein ACKOCD_06800 [Nitrospiraceae bacterium]
MLSGQFPSHLTDAQSIERALASVESRLERLRLNSLEKKLGCPLADLMRATEALPGASWALRFSDERAFLLSLAEEAARSEFGRFLLCARGLNWRTTDLLFDPDYQAALRRQEREGTLCLFDRLAFFTFPIFLATQERARIHQKHAQPFVREGAALASLPCGRMRDLLTLDFTRIAGDIRLVGLDKDPDAVRGAEMFAAELSETRLFTGSLDIRLGDALTPGFATPGIREAFDLLTSAGLNMDLNDSQCATFYRHVHESLKPGGTFVTGHIVPAEAYRWERIDRNHWRLQMAVMTVLVGALWETYVKPAEQVRAQLTAAGFRDVRTIPDAQGIFPTFVSKKS